MRKTKIICTLGPATDKGGVLQELVLKGMNVARMNFSHGSYEEHERRLRELKEVMKTTNQFIAVLMDTKGPEIRIKQFSNHKVELVENQEFVLTTNEIEGNEHEVSVTYLDLCRDVFVGTRILIDDGLIEMRVDRIEAPRVICKVINGGIISDYKGVNIPDENLNLPYLSEKDRLDLLWGVEHDVDYIAASFVRNADDVMQIRNLLKENDADQIKIIAKIENKQGVQNIDEIMEVSDGIMIARGDMGVELPYEEVPIIQKMIIKKACAAGKTVITATQMLDSMMKNPRPTRAEMTDVANAIYDGTGAIMLSGETAAGQYPVEAVKVMVRIAERTEEDIDYRKRFLHREGKENPDTTDAISHATCTTAHDLQARAIITVTKSGISPRMVSRYRPNCSIIGCSTDDKVCRQLSLVWGVIPLLMQERDDVLELFQHATQIAKDNGYLKTGDIVVITSGVPLGRSGTTNMIKVHRV